MSNDHVRLHVEASVVLFFLGGGDSVQKMCTTAPYRIMKTDSRSTTIAQIYLDFFEVCQVYLNVILRIFLRST